MRLIGDFDSEKEAYQFYCFLMHEGIQSTYDPFIDPHGGKKKFEVWVYEENDLEFARTWLEEFRKNPTDPKFASAPPPVIKTPEPEVAPDVLPPEPPVGVRRILLRRSGLSLTNFLLILCIFLFLWNDVQEARILQKKGAIGSQLLSTSLQQNLLFDYPAAFACFEEKISALPLQDYKDVKELPPEVHVLFEEAEEMPMWKGVYSLVLHKPPTGPIPMFEKISQGEYWRLFTPCLLHRDFLHILFNMAWLWILGRQIEERVPGWKMGIFILIVGVISNLAQYLMSGPYFLGFSGVVVAMAGFIWSRQRKFPWEGYPLQRATALFVLFFVLAMFILEIAVFTLQLLDLTQLSASIANTAHIVGGLTGLLLGRLPFFSRRKG